MLPPGCILRQSVTRSKILPLFEALPLKEICSHTVFIFIQAPKKDPKGGSKGGKTSQKPKDKSSSGGKAKKKVNQQFRPVLAV
jgi:hypothetical protein